MIGLGLVACAPGPLGGGDFAAGDLTLVYLGLRGPPTGQATLIVGPEAAWLIDVGNDAHADRVADALDAFTPEGTVRGVWLTHLHEDHAGGLQALLAAGRVTDEVGWRGPRFDGDRRAARIREILSVHDVDDGAWCDLSGCDFPVSRELGGAATITVWGGGGVFGDATWAPVAGENDLSAVISVSAWAFDAVIAGDLPGGGKGTHPVESFAVSHLSGMPLAADVLTLNHHGIDSSSSEAWLDRWLPDDGVRHDAIVGANGGYLSAPDGDVIDRVRPRLGRGEIWVTRPGLLADRPDERVDVDGDVVVRATTGGTWAIDAR